MTVYHKTKESQDVEHMLSSGKPGEIITPREITAAIGLPAESSQDRGWQVVSSLIQRVEKSHELFWRWDRIKKHWKCLTNDEKTADMHDRVKRINSQARRNERVMRTIDFDTLADSLKREAVVNCAISNAVRICTSKKSVKTLEMFAGQQPALPDETTLMRLFLQ